jgi:hypothetical protein
MHTCKYAQISWGKEEDTFSQQIGLEFKEEKKLSNASSGAWPGMVLKVGNFGK